MPLIRFWPKFRRNRTMIPAPINMIVWLVPSLATPLGGKFFDPRVHKDNIACISMFTPTVVLTCLLEEFVSGHNSRVPTKQEMKMDRKQFCTLFQWKQTGVGPRLRFQMRRSKPHPMSSQCAVATCYPFLLMELIVIYGPLSSQNELTRNFDRLLQIL